MNQLIVILLVLRNFLKPIRFTLGKFILCTIGLGVTLYAYKIYNSIQDQIIDVRIVHSENEKVDMNNLHLVFNYGDPETKHYKLGDEDSLKGTSFFLTQMVSIDKQDSINKFDANTILPLLESTNLNSDIDSIFMEATQFSLFQVLVDWQENNWIFPHFNSLRKVFDHGKVVKKQITRDALNINQFQEITKERITDKMEGAQINPFYRKRRYYMFEDLIASSDTTMIYIQQFHSPHPFFIPKYHSAYDISQLELRISLQVDTLTSLSFSFLPLCNLQELSPSPDYRDGTTISYTDPLKIETLQNRGLHFLLEFPKSKSIQEARNFILSAVITLFLTLLCTQGYSIIRKILNERKTKVKQAYRIIQSREESRIHILRTILPYNIIFSLVIGMTIILINPYDWNLFEKIIIILYCMLLVVQIQFIRVNRIYKKILTTKLDNNLKNYKYWLWKLSFLFVILCSILIVINLSSQR